MEKGEKRVGQQEMPLSGSPGGHCSTKEVSVPWGSSSLSHQNVRGCEVTHKISFSIHGKYHWCGFMLLTHGISCLRLWLCSLVVIVVLFCLVFLFEIQELSNSMPWSCQVMMLNGQCSQTSPLKEAVLKPAMLRRWS